MIYLKVYLITIFEIVYHTSTGSAQVFLVETASLKITCLEFDLKLYFNSLSIQVLRPISNSAAVLRLCRTRLLIYLYFSNQAKVCATFVIRLLGRAAIP